MKRLLGQCVRIARWQKCYVQQNIRVWVSVCVLVISVLAGDQAKAAQPALPNDTNVIIIKNDRGGLVRQRANQIALIKQSGQQVEISGRQCLSSCTMYLGLENVCVSPRTLFGFHGPSRFGKALDAADFEYWSQFIAGHFPTPLRSWYLQTGRTRINGYYKISGRELIRLGITQCAT